MPEFKTVSIATLALMAALATGGPAQALQAGDWLVRAGVAHVSPNDDSDALVAIPGSEVGVDSATRLGITLTYMASDQIGIGVLAAWPFKHDLKGAGSIASLGEIGETKQLPPTVTAQWHFMPNGSVRPYVGAGINYTNFFSEDAKGALAGTRIRLDDSWGWALEAGADVDISQDWFLSAQLWYLDIDTKAKLSGGPLSLSENVDVQIDPWVFMLGVGRAF